MSQGNTLIRCGCLDGGAEVVTIVDSFFGNGYKIFCPSCGQAVLDIELDNAAKSWNRLRSNDLIAKYIASVDSMKSLWYKFGGFYNRSGFSTCNIKPKMGGFLYIANTVGTDQYKIGMTKDISQRMKSLKTGNPHLKIIATKRVLNPRAEEAMLHRIYKDHRIEGEWFTFLGIDIQEAIKKYGFNFCIVSEGN